MSNETTERTRRLELDDLDDQPTRVPKIRSDVRAGIAGATSATVHRLNGELGGAQDGARAS